MNKLKFSVMIPTRIPSLYPPNSFNHALQYNYRKLDFIVIRRFVLNAEKLRYNSIWVSDHLSREAVRERFECWTILSWLASLTKDIRLGSMVLCNLYRHPSLMAQMASTLDVLSTGRLEFGIGACWNEDECINHGIEYAIPKVRLQMLKESIEIIKRFWIGENVTYKGKYYRIMKAFSEPKPIQKPYPPILIGGGGEKLTLRIVAKLADKSNFSGSLEVISKKMEILKKYCNAIGRNYESIEKTCNIAVVIHPTLVEYIKDMRKRYLAAGSLNTFEKWLEKAELSYIAGTPEMCLKQIKAYVDVGVQHFIIRFGDIPKIDGLKLFAKEVIPKIVNK